MTQSLKCESQMERGRATLVDGVCAALGDVEALIAAMDARVYTDASLDPCFGSTIGAHVRHVTDHARALADAIESGVADYEQRDRGDGMETDKALATARLRSIARRIGAVSPTEYARSIRVSVIARAGEPAQMVDSTVEREAAFVMSHTIHHIAIMRQIAARAGADSGAARGVSCGLGLAHGTPRGHEGNGPEHGACAH